jgi:hypothetical protein
MIIDWIKEFETDEEKKNFERQFHNASDVLEKLSQIYQKRLAALDLQERDFSPGWEYKIASLIGRREEMKQLLKLIDLDQ